ncbi:MAG: exonuclease domain-containing protein [Bacteroidota bacterium]
MRYAIIDIETTGGTPKESKITEIGIYIHDGENIVDEFVSLINPEIPITAFVVQLTGINNKMVATAPKFYELAKKIIEITEGCVFVAHNVGFDYTIIRNEFKSLGYDYRRSNLCTVRTSRAILPGMDSYSLGKLTRALGIALSGRHRAGGDALATTHLFKLLLDKDPNKLSTFVQKEIDPQELHPKLDLEFIETIPARMGIYKLFNEVNQLLYIGKGDLKKKVEHHLKYDKTKKGIELRSEIARVEFQITGSELIANILQTELLDIQLPPNNRLPKAKELTLFQEDTSYFIIDKGRHKSEKSLVLMENGSLIGYGFAPFHFHNLDVMHWKRFIEVVKERAIVNDAVTMYLQKAKGITKVMI